MQAPESDGREKSQVRYLAALQELLDCQTSKLIDLMGAPATLRVHARDTWLAYVASLFDAAKKRNRGTSNDTDDEDDDEDDDKEEEADGKGDEDGDDSDDAAPSAAPDRANNAEMDEDAQPPSASFSFFSPSFPPPPPPALSSSSLRRPAKRRRVSFGADVAAGPSSSSSKKSATPLRWDSIPPLRATLATCLASASCLGLPLETGDVLRLAEAHVLPFFLAATAVPALARFHRRFNFFLRPILVPRYELERLTVHIAMLAGIPSFPRPPVATWIHRVETKR
jgi:hypothetical protein